MVMTPTLTEGLIVCPPPCTASLNPLESQGLTMGVTDEGGGGISLRQREVAALQNNKK